MMAMDAAVPPEIKVPESPYTYGEPLSQPRICFEQALRRRRGRLAWAASISECLAKAAALATRNPVYLAAPVYSRLSKWDPSVMLQYHRY
ncbi:hypothetical protein Cob_v004540 [Colletotrichum orbiculare MAFF 240422]|uniref:Uncharacterized protein n=1 Tax=Colletotrichum orbiculare (strain 104-T / ATCC 96160 / CBS 514.97 / LARS 414 / MAFF 240422) TaxID=1213857 RepID=A0A484FWH4_COLOR|nr:hypothetical protein Cob_v004540 [Colletotrichum orbiculare MAFF 240422]